MFVLQIPDELQDAIQPEGVTGWDVVLAIAVFVVAIPISRGVDRLASKAARQVPGISADTASGHPNRVASWWAGGIPRDRS